MNYEVVHKSIVDFVDKMGTDLTVANAARVSFDKHKDVFDEGDAKLLDYLATHNHWTPFAHPQMQLRITAPIFVARQLVKHQIGLVWNEVSRRYVSDEPTYFIPQKWRGKPINGAKQGSHGEVIIPDHLILKASNLMELSVEVYKDYMDIGVAPEQARIWLLQNMMTSWYWTGSLQACARICTLRLDAHAQGETADVARCIDAICQAYFPNAWEALARSWRNV